MTILVAAYNADHSGIHILSDSMAADNFEKFDIGCKWSEFSNFYLGITGEAVVITIIRDYIKEQLNSIDIQSKKDIIELYKLIETTLKTEMGSKTTEHETRDYLNFDISIVTKRGKIFSCSAFLYVIEHDRFMVSGSGSSYMK